MDVDFNDHHREFDMSTATKTLIDLETKFWQSMVDQDADTAIHMLSEPALMVSSHGAMKFDHAGYRSMAEKGPMVVTDFELSDMDVLMPSDSTAILTYRVRQTVAPRDADSRPDQHATTQDMLDSSTWIRDGDSWRCVMHTETPAVAAGQKH
jgi:hypothetical protein